MATDLLTAMQTLTNKLIPNSTGEKRHLYELRLATYALRSAGQSAPVVQLAAEPESEADEPLSPFPTAALVQIFAAAGTPFTVNPDGTLDTFEDIERFIAVASPEQIRQVALIGFFGSTGSRSDVDYSLRQQYYDLDPDGNETPKPQYFDVGGWHNYVKGL